MAALLLWILDASLNISMEPFRAFVGDMLRKDQHTAGYAVQTAFIGAGAVVGSIFPWLLDIWGVSNVAPAGGIPDTVRYSFWFGGAALFVAVLWTVLIDPRIFAGGDGALRRKRRPSRRRATRCARSPRGASAQPGLDRRGRRWSSLAVVKFGLEKEVYLLGGLLIAYGLASVVAILLARRGPHDQHARQHRRRFLRHADR